jgi:hypothetical protein
MTTTEFIQRVRDIASYDLSLLRSADEPDASDAAIVQNANEVLADWAEKLGMLDINISLSMTVGEAMYNGEGPRFSRKILAPKTIRIDDNIPIYVTSYEEFILNYPYWSTSAVGRPFRAGWDGLNLYVYPKPDATATSLTTVVTAIYIPVIDIDATGAELDIPGVLHPHLAYKTVAQMCKHSTLDNTQMALLAKFNADADDALDRISRRKSAARRQSVRPVQQRWIKV